MERWVWCCSCVWQRHSRAIEAWSFWVVAWNRMTPSEPRRRNASRKRFDSWSDGHASDWDPSGWHRRRYNVNIPRDKCCCRKHSTALHNNPNQSNKIYHSLFQISNFFAGKSIWFQFTRFNNNNNGRFKDVTRRDRTRTHPLALTVGSILLSGCALELLLLLFFYLTSILRESQLLLPSWLDLSIQEKK